MGFDESYDAAAARWPDGWTAAELETSWGRTHLLRAGPADAPVVMLLHGGGATATAWADLARELAGRYRVYAADQPGDPGLSSSSRQFRSTEDMVSWLDELRTACKVERWHLVGHSAGAHLALSYALAHSERVASLGLLDPTFCFGGMRPSYLLHALPSLIRPTEKSVRRFLAWETENRPLPTAWLDTYVVGAVAAGRPRIVRTRRPHRRDLEKLRVRTLVLMAGESRAHDVSRVAREAASLPSVAVTTIPGATHHTMPLLDAPLLSAALDAHFRNKAPAADESGRRR